MKFIVLASLICFLLVSAGVRGAEFDDELIAQAQAGDLQGIRQAIASGTDVNTVNRNNASLVLVAATMGYLDMLTFLLSEGADPNLPNSKGTTPVYVASQLGREDIAATLLEYGADPNIVIDAYLSTPLMAAAVNGRGEIVRLLLEHGADTDLTNNEGATVMDLVHSESQPTIAALLDAAD